MQLFIVRVHRDEELLKKLDEQVAEFLTEVEKEIEALNKEWEK